MDIIIKIIGVVIALCIVGGVGYYLYSNSKSKIEESENFKKAKDTAEDLLGKK